MSANFNFYLNRQGIKGTKGDTGDAGFSPLITVKTNTANEYVLNIQNEGNSFDTPNLRGNAIENEGGTYVRFNPVTGSMYTGFADIASTEQYGEVILNDYNALAAGGSESGAPTSAAVYQFVMEQSELASFDFSKLAQSLVAGTGIALNVNPINETITINNSIDLSPYVTNSSLAATLTDYVTFSNLTTVLSDYSTISSVDSKLENKQDIITAHAPLYFDKATTQVVNYDFDNTTNTYSPSSNSGSVIFSGVSNSSNQVTVSYSNVASLAYISVPYKYGQIFRLFKGYREEADARQRIASGFGYNYSGFPIYILGRVVFPTSTTWGHSVKLINDSLINAAIDNYSGGTDLTVGEVSTVQVSSDTENAEVYAQILYNSNNESYTVNILDKTNNLRYTKTFTSADSGYNEISKVNDYIVTIDTALPTAKGNYYSGTDIDLSTVTISDFNSLEFDNIFDYVGDTSTGTNLYIDTSAFATAAQGSLASTAVQPNDNISVLTNDAGYTTNIGTVTSVNGSTPDSSGNVTISTGGTVDQTYDSTSANAQSGVAIAGANFIQNTGEDAGSIGILGTTTGSYSIAIGRDSVASNGRAIAIGNNASAAGQFCTAIGYNAKITNSTLRYAMQLGEGTNTQAYTLQYRSYRLIDQNGKVPVERLISFTGADGTNVGAIGAVPAPAATDNTKFLKGDGTWAEVITGISRNTGELLTDAELLADVKNYAHSTFDRSKFTVVGSPNITDDGIVSGFSSSNYLRIPNLNISGATNFELTTGWFSLSDNSLDFIPIINWGSTDDGETKFALFYRKTNGNIDLTIYQGALGIGGGSIPSAYVSLNKLFNVKIVYKDTKWNAYYKTLDSDWVQFVTDRQDNTGVIITTQRPIGWKTSAEYLTGSIDLKQFSITVDGVEVFSGNKTGIDTIKPDDYTVIGSPTISADGIASGFSVGNYVTTSALNISNVTDFELYTPYFNLKTPSIDNNQVLNWNAYTGTRINVWQGKSTPNEVRCIIINDNFQSSLKTYSIDQSKYYQMKFIYRNQRWNSYIKEVNAENWVQLHNDIADATPVSVVGIRSIGYANSNNYLENGSIDLNSFKIYVDGNLVYQPCLKVPYTQSKTGSKVVNASYRDRVNDMADQFGYAPYYTLSDTDFTLPQVELFGLIGNKTLRDSYYNGVTYWELFSNGRLEQGGTCVSGVEYTLPRPFADANYTLTIPYSSKTATSFIPSATGDFIAKGMGLL